MADDEEILDEEEEELNLVAIAIAAFILLAIVGAIVWYFFLREEPQTDETKPVWQPPENVQTERITDLFPQIIVNPFDSEGRYFLVVKFDIVMNDPGRVAGEILGKPWRLSEAKNRVIDIFSRYTMAQIRTAAIKERTRREIVDELNAMLGWTPEDTAAAEETGEKPPIETVYFSKYILQ